MKKLIILTTFLSLNATRGNFFDIEDPDIENLDIGYESHEYPYGYMPGQLQCYLSPSTIISTKMSVKSLREILIEKITSMDISKEELETLPLELQDLIIEERKIKHKPLF